MSLPDGPIATLLDKTVILATEQGQPNLASNLNLAVFLFTHLTLKSLLSTEKTIILQGWGSTFFLNMQ